MFGTWKPGGTKCDFLTINSNDFPVGGDQDHDCNGKRWRPAAVSFWRRHFLHIKRFKFKDFNSISYCRVTVGPEKQTQMQPPGKTTVPEKPR